MHSMAVMKEAHMQQVCVLNTSIMIEWSIASGWVDRISCLSLWVLRGIDVRIQTLVILVVLIRSVLTTDFLVS